MEFDKEINRHGTGSLKWDRFKGTDVLPFWVADMDFESPPEVLAALRERVSHGVFGYTIPPESAVRAVCEYLERQHGFTISPDWLVWSPGLVPSLNLACRAFAEKGDGVMTFVPSYPPFLTAPGYAERELLTVALLPRGDNSGWEIDWEQMESKVTPRTRLFLLSHPQNPVGKAFSENELAQIGAFCVKHDLILCSDEIHCDLQLGESRHISAGTLSPEILKRTIILMSPSKTYNLAGLACAYLVIPDESLRNRYKRAARGIITEINLFGYAGCEAAYRFGEAWRQRLLACLGGNRDRVYQVLCRYSQIRLRPMDATYLAWLDVRSMDVADASGAFEKGGVGLSDGVQFGQPGFLRLNFGCPRAMLDEGLQRMERVLSSHAQS